MCLFHEVANVQSRKKCLVYETANLQSLKECLFYEIANLRFCEKNVYLPQDIISNSNNPRIIGKWELNDNKEYQENKEWEEEKKLHYNAYFGRYKDLLTDGDDREGGGMQHAGSSGRQLNSEPGDNSFQRQA